MTAVEIMGEIRKEMEVKDVKLSRIVQLMNCSRSTAYRKLRNPEELTIDDLERIGSYLNMRLSIQGR